jgi:hypothetical protein
MTNDARLREALKQAADVIEGLYAELKRKPPLEGANLIKELRTLAAKNSN